MTNQRLFIGGYTRVEGHAPAADGQGLYALEFDPFRGQLGEARLAAQTVNPSFVALHPEGHTLYAVSEVEDGQLLAYRVGAGGELGLLGQRSTQGHSPAHVSVDPSGRLVLAVNYASGASVLAYQLEPDGGLGEMIASVRHCWSPRPSQDAGRQEGPHPHQVLVAPDGLRACVTDLGADEIVTYDLRPGRELQGLHVLSLPPGSGPRHLRFGPPGLAFVTFELRSEVATLRHDPLTGELELLGTTSTLPPDFREPNWPAEVLVSLDGRQVYVTNRGHDSVAAFEVGADGTLALIECLPTGGRTPRGATWSPDGGHLLCANQNSSSVTVFQRDPASGRLRAVGLFPCPTPTSVVGWPVRA